MVLWILVPLTIVLQLAKASGECGLSPLILFQDPKPAFLASSQCASAFYSMLTVGGNAMTTFLASFDSQCYASQTQTPQDVWLSNDPAQTAGGCTYFDAINQEVGLKSCTSLLAIVCISSAAGPGSVTVETAQSSTTAFETTDTTSTTTTQPFLTTATLQTLTATSSVTATLTVTIPASTVTTVESVTTGTSTTTTLTVNVTVSTDATQLIIVTTLIDTIFVSPTSAIYTTITSLQADIVTDLTVVTSTLDSCPTVTEGTATVTSTPQTSAIINTTLSIVTQVIVQTTYNTTGPCRPLSTQTKRSTSTRTRLCVSCTTTVTSAQCDGCSLMNDQGHHQDHRPSYSGQRTGHEYQGRRMHEKGWDVCGLDVLTTCPVEQADWTLVASPVSYRHAECACLQAGRSRVATIRTPTDLQAALQLVYSCLGPQQQAWINSTTLYGSGDPNRGDFLYSYHQQYLVVLTGPEYYGPGQDVTRNGGIGVPPEPEHIELAVLCSA
jgi:hypothetical protein